jgi:hypothetical protein
MMALVVFLNSNRPAQQAANSRNTSATEVVPIEEYRGVVLLPRRASGRAVAVPAAAEPKTFDDAA